MSLKIVFHPEDKQAVADKHSQTVADRLEKVIKNKNETLQWKDSITECRRRFYNIVHKGGEYFPEIAFSPKQTNYRAILAWLPNAECLVVYAVVEKTDHYQSSKQHALLDQIYKHPKEVVESVEAQFTAQQSTVASHSPVTA
ncbi:hypothetical protein [Salinibaculum rarum]|uniref:hypothetical protein n=1 Tax=Salinibaculum rarum TaxID=3058903 RepID=UPI00265EEE1A|nr:hypothetical protein [Salinibaculum sp. KK48]